MSTKKLLMVDMYMNCPFADWERWRNVCVAFKAYNSISNGKRGKHSLSAIVSRFKLKGIGAIWLTRFHTTTL